MPYRRLVADRNGRNQAVCRGANRDLAPPRRSVKVCRLEKDLNRDWIAEEREAQQPPANLLRLPSRPQALKHFLDDRPTSGHAQEVLSSWLGPPNEHLDPHGGVDAYRLPPQPKLATGIRSHIRKVAEPFDFANLISQALNPPHAYGFLQREVHRRRVGLDTKNSNRLVQEILIKHKSCAFHVPMVVGKVAV